VSIPFTDELFQGQFLERPNRFLVRCAMGETIVEAHLPDPGRLKELLVPGCTIYLRQTKGEKRKTQWSAVLAQAPNSTLVSLNTTLANRLVAQALAEKALPELAGWNLVKAEYSHGPSRWDFFLAKDNGERLFLEVKSVTLVVDGVGYFPDAVTTRGARHVRELAMLAQEENTQAAVLFLAQRQDVHVIKPARAIDPQFAAELEQAARAGVMLLGRKTIVTTAEVMLGGRVAVELG